MSKLQPFTSNMADNSTDAGFQFTFFCDLCQDGFKTKFVESKTHKKASFLRGIGQAVSFGASLVGKDGVGYRIERGSDMISERFMGMPPQWHKEREQAFELAQNEAKGVFHRCPKCRKWVCATCWNEQGGLCTDCAPRMAAEVASARAQKMVEDIQAKAAKTQVFTGEIEEKQTICPRCGKPAGEGKFCGNCGANLQMTACYNCGTKSPTGTRFCPECGTRLE
jgi:RNA polymerase subunit RPABC4/transcription elongation factor Spt4